MLLPFDCGIVLYNPPRLEWQPWYSRSVYASANIAYGYSYLFAFPIDLPAGARTITLPDNDKIRVLAISVAEENPGVKPAQPLYDLLAAPPAGADDFALRIKAGSISVPKEEVARRQSRLLAEAISEPVSL